MQLPNFAIDPRRQSFYIPIDFGTPLAVAGNYDAPILPDQELFIANFMFFYTTAVALTVNQNMLLNSIDGINYYTVVTLNTGIGTTRAPGVSGIYGRWWRLFKGDNVGSLSNSLLQVLIDP